MQEIIDDEAYTPLETEKPTKHVETIFRSEYINFLPSKIELVRNKFVFEKLSYDTIVEILLSDGYLIKNRWLIRILSLIAIYFTAKFIHFGLIVSGGLVNWNLSQWFNKSSLISFWGPLLIFVGTSFALYQSFIKSPILTIKTPTAQHVVRIKYLEENRTLEELKVYLNKKGLQVSDKRNRNEKGIN